MYLCPPDTVKGKKCWVDTKVDFALFWLQINLVKVYYVADAQNKTSKILQQYN